MTATQSRQSSGTQGNGTESNGSKSDGTRTNLINGSGTTSHIAAAGVVSSHHGEDSDGARNGTLPGRFGVASPQQLHREHEEPPEPMVRVRRRRWPWAVVILVTVGALGAGSFIVGRVTKPAPPPPPPPPPPPATATVLALAHGVTQGQVLSRADLTVVTIVTGPGDRKGDHRPSPPSLYLSSSVEGSVLGQRVIGALPKGALLLPGELSESPFPARGQALVGLDLQPNEAPTGGALVAGDQVGVLYVPSASEPPYPAPQPLAAAHVVASVAGQSGDSFLTVLVPARLAASVAAYADHDELALVRLGPGVAWPPRVMSPPPPVEPATATVLALANSVNEGQALHRDDLMVVTIVTGPGHTSGTRPSSTRTASTAVAYLPSSAEASILGRHARSALPKGALLLPADLTEAPFPAKGQALVGLDLQPGETPTGNALLAGDRVGVLFVPASAQPPYPAPKPLFSAQVVAAVAGQSGGSYVTVLVPVGDAARLAAYAQHDEVALVRLGPGSVWPQPSVAARPKPSPLHRAAPPSSTTATTVHHRPGRAGHER